MNKQESNNFIVPSWMDLGDENISKLCELYDFEDCTPYSVILKSNDFHCSYLERDEYGDLITKQLIVSLSKFTNEELKYILEDEEIL